MAVLDFVTAHGNSREALQLAERLFNWGARLVEQLWEQAGLVPGILAIRDES
jgi:hypothetical protein